MNIVVGAHSATPADIYSDWKKVIAKFNWSIDIFYSDPSSTAFQFKINAVSKDGSRMVSTAVMGVGGIPSTFLADFPSAIMLVSGPIEAGVETV